jgi:hypothetical protein
MRATLWMSCYMVHIGFIEGGKHIRDLNRVPKYHPG